MLRRLIACLLFLLATAVAAQQPAAEPRLALSQYRIDGWQTEQGLPMDTVQALLQTRDGSLWVGTGAGLARFDGLRFSGFADSNRPEMARYPVFGFLEDSQGRLWIGHSRGASIYSEGRFTPVFTAEHTGGRRVWSFAQDRDGSIWAASEQGLLHWKAGAIRISREADGLPSDKLRALAIDASDGSLWIATTGGGLARRFSDGRIERVADAGHAEIRHLLADPAGGVWVATAGAGLLHIAADGSRRRYGLADGLPSEHLTYLARDASGALWIGHWGAGLSRLAEGRVQVLRDGLAGQQVWSLLADREGSVWVGSWNGGLNRLRPRVFAVLGQPEGLGGDNVRAVLHTRSGETWLATAGGGVARRLHDGSLQLLRERDGLASDEASALHEDPDGTVWIGSYTAGLTRWRDGRLQRFGLAQGLPHVDVRALRRDRAGRLWVGTKLGLAYWDETSQRFVAVPGLPDEGVVVLLEARDGDLWAGTSGRGLLRLRDGQLIETLGRPQGLASNWILALHEDEAGTLWIGTNGEGISRRARDGRLKTIGPADGLWDGIIQSLLPDQRGQFWISCNRGFFRVARAELEAFASGARERVHSVGYGPGDALRSTTFAGGLQPAGSVDAQGRIWLPSLKGVVIVDPERLPDAGQPPALHIAEVEVGGRWSPPPAGELQLPAGSVPLTLRYAADTVLNAERVRFRFLMEGLSPDWIATGTTREARFPKLPPGSYRFRVAASLDGQHWRESTDTLAIRVPPLPHQNPWLQGLAALLLAAAGYSAYRLRTHQLRRRQDEMERVIAEKTEALRQANEHLSRLSFSDALTGLANRRRLDEVLDSEWRRMARLGLPLAVIVADIDSFKDYNDALGHAEGDRCLVQVADLIRRQAGRAGDFVARYGGEEFVFLLPGLDREAALAHAETVRAAIEAAALPHPASKLAAVVTLSLGVASTVPTTEASPTSLFAEADAALYRAKLAGRNRVA